MVVKTVNDLIGLDGISPTVAVNGCIPRLGLKRDRPSPSTYQRAFAVKKATNSLTKCFARRQVHDALQTQNGPNDKGILSAPIGSHALVYRTQKDRWEGPFTMLDTERDDIFLLFHHGPPKF